jgi:hypothetical protein
MSRLSGLKAFAPVSLQVSNFRLTGRHRLDNDGGAAGWEAAHRPMGVWKWP